MARISARPEDVAAQDAHAREAGRLRKKARKELWEFLKTPVGERRRKIRRAYRRFRSRAFVELLLQRIRTMVRDAPSEAAELARLVPLALRWTTGKPASTWAVPLIRRADAWAANALRVAGDLTSADRAFLRLRRSMAQHPVGDPAALAEIASLEASLRMDQRRYPRAKELLTLAALACELTGDRLALARVQLQQANLLQLLDEPASVLELFCQAAETVKRIEAPYLYLCAVTGQVNALCDLERFSEARRLLDRHLDAYEDSDAASAGAVLRCLQGRVALGTGDFEMACHSFGAACEAMHTLGRTYDAAYAALYLAETLHAAGRTEELRSLAGQLVSQFSSRGVAPETYKAVQLFARAVAADRLTLPLLAELRTRIVRRPLGTSARHEPT